MLALSNIHMSSFYFEEHPAFIRSVSEYTRPSKELLFVFVDYDPAIKCKEKSDETTGCGEIIII
jgi:hypothetical protein